MIQTHDFRVDTLILHQQSFVGGLKVNILKVQNIMEISVNSTTQSLFTLKQNRPLYFLMYLLIHLSSKY